MAVKVRQQLLLQAWQKKAPKVRRTSAVSTFAVFIDYNQWRVMETHDVFVHDNGVFNHVFLFSNFSDHFQMTFEPYLSILISTALQDAVAMGPLSFSELWPNHSTGSRWLNSDALRDEYS